MQLVLVVSNLICKESADSRQYGNDVHESAKREFSHICILFGSKCRWKFVVARIYKG